MTETLNARQIIGLWPNSDVLGEDLGLKRGGDHVRIMRLRGRIARSHWDRMLEAARRRGIDLTADMLEAAHSSPPTAPEPLPEPEKAQQ